MATVFLDAHYTICFYTAANTTVNGDWMVANEAEICADGFKRPWDYFRPYFQMAPALFRFLQCLRRYQSSREAFPHLVNAGKYSTTFFVVIFSTLKGEYPGDVFFYLWLISAVANSIYAYAWDIKMDWGLLDGGENPVLRDEMVYSSRGYYYFAIAEDALLRLKKLPSSSLKKFFVFAVPKSICLSQYSFCSSDKHSPSNEESDELTRPCVLGVTEEIICSFLRRGLFGVLPES